MKEVTRYDMEKVAAALKEEGLIEYEWFFRLFSWVYHWCGSDRRCSWSVSSFCSGGARLRRTGGRGKNRVPRNIFSGSSCILPRAHIVCVRLMSEVTHMWKGALARPRPM